MCFSATSMFASLFGGRHFLHSDQSKHQNQTTKRFQQGSTTNSDTRKAARKCDCAARFDPKLIKAVTAEKTRDAKEALMAMRWAEFVATRTWFVDHDTQFQNSTDPDELYGAVCVTALAKRLAWIPTEYEIAASNLEMPDLYLEATKNRCDRAVASMSKLRQRWEAESVEFRDHWTETWEMLIEEALDSQSERGVVLSSDEARMNGWPRKFKFEDGRKITVIQW